MVAMKVLLLLASMSVVALARNLSLTLEERIARLEGISQDLSRQVSLQAFYSQEMTRTEVYSGIIQTRLRKTGSKNYFSDSHIGDAFMGMHDHPELERTVGLDELSVVLNGYQFRTEHNDYELVMPSSKNQNYHATENIPFPPVPDSVLNKTSVQEQIVEMQEYFKAFAQQNLHGGRDHRKYFLPNLCYMEGSWSNLTDADGIQQPFDNNRHNLDATSWKNLLEKAQYHAYTGSHAEGGNLAYLPISMYNGEDGKPFFAQWEYRILCHPLTESLPTGHLRPLEDLNDRLRKRMTPGEAMTHPGQRFVINAKDYDDSSSGGSTLDRLMRQIPGKNNYKGYVEDHTLGGVMTTINGSIQPMNTNFYHRYFKTADKGAMGTKAAFRGYNDANCWVAQTTQAQVISFKAGKCRTDTCSTHASYTFAIPLEIIYTTPLARWNPYRVAEQEERQNLPVPNLHVGEGVKQEMRAYYPNRIHEPNRIAVKDVTEGGKRNGGVTSPTAFKGASSLHFYKTPRDFYSQASELKTAGVLDSTGQVRHLVSSGIRTFTPDIPGVGPVRLRYPIAPVSGEGQTLSKELNALKEIVLHDGYKSIYDHRPCLDVRVTKEKQTHVLVTFKLPTTTRDPPGEHSHRFKIAETELTDLKKAGHSKMVTTSLDQGHVHELKIVYNATLEAVVYEACDYRKDCWDGHPHVLEEAYERTTKN